MDNMRKEFEVWANREFDINCSEMSFGLDGNDKREQYHNDDDPDGAIIVSAMFYAWKSSRAALCVELPNTPGFSASDEPDLAFEWGVEVMKDLIESAGVTCK